MNIEGKNIGAAGDVDIDEQNNYFGLIPVSLPNTIPSMADFVGRDEYLKEFREFFSNGKRCFVLHGPGGVGKTALALQYANEIAQDFKAKIFVDMQGMGQNPLSARDSLLEIVWQFDRNIPSDISDSHLKSIFVQFVGNQSTLVILDNAQNKRSVETLRQGNACLIITSREAFALTGSYSKRIEKMSLIDARQLLFAIATEDRFEGRADELCHLADYLPMALKPLASILSEDALETVASLTSRYINKQELFQEQVPDYNLTLEETLTVGASFELSFERLSEYLKKYWQRLSVFPADFDEKAMSAVLEISTEEATKIQKQLRKFSLLEVSIETKRFYLHDLARSYAQMKFAQEDEFRTRYMFAKHYESILHVTMQMRFAKEKNSFLKALKLIDNEWSNIIAAQKWLEDSIEENQEVAGLSIRYSINPFLSLRLTPDEQIRWQKISLTAAKIRSDKVAEGNLLQNIGNGYILLQNHEKAREHYEQALLIARELGHAQGESQCLGNLGAAYYRLGNLDKAIECHEQSLKIKRTLGDRRGEGKTMGNLGNIYHSQQNYKESIVYYEQSLLISREVGDPQDEGQALSSLGNAYDSLGEKEKACKLWVEALAVLTLINAREVKGLKKFIELKGCKNA